MTIPTNPLTFNAFVTAIAALGVYQVTQTSSVNHITDTTLDGQLGNVLNYAELRIQRDLDLLPLQTSNAYTLTSGNNIFSVPAADFVTVQTLSIAGVPLTPVSKEWLQNVYGANANMAQPTYFAPYGGDLATAGQTSANYLLGPWPDSNYPVSVTGTQRMPSLYLSATPSLAGSAATFISTWLPDLLIQASMIFIAEYQHNWGAASSDPEQGPTFEANYQNLLKGGLVEEARKKFQASAWSSMSPPLVATGTR